MSSVAARSVDAATTSRWTVSTRSGPDDPEWDAFVERTPGGHYAQSTLWARIKEPSGWNATRVIVSGDGEIVAGAQVMTRSWRGIGGIGYIPKGPLLRDGDEIGPQIVVDALRRLAARRRLRYLAVQPPINAHGIERSLREAGFRANPDIGTHHATVQIDLTRTESDLLARMRKSTRQKVRRAQNRGIVVHEGHQHHLDTLYELLKTASERKGFPIPPREYYEHMWHTFVTSEHMRIFVAEYDGEAVSAQLAIPFGQTFYTHVTAWSGRHSALLPNEALEWHTMMWAKDHGYRYFDFEGIDPSISARLRRGLREEDHQVIADDPKVTVYKLGYDRQYTPLPVAYEYVPNPLLRWSYFVVYPAVAERPPLRQLRNAVLPSQQ